MNLWSRHHFAMRNVSFRIQMFIAKERQNWELSSDHSVLGPERYGSSLYSRLSMLFHSTFFHYNIDEKKAKQKLVPTGATLCGVGTFLPSVHEFSLGTPGSSHRCAYELSRQV